MSTKKQYLRSKPVCKITFRLPKSEAGSARTVSLAGEFNNWNSASTPMKSLKNGDFTVSLVLDTGHEYQYRFILDGQRWVTDPQADKQVECRQYNCLNSVVIV